MHLFVRICVIGAFILGALGTQYVPASCHDLPLNRLRLPPGFKIELYARVPQARSMAMSPNGVLYVGTHEDNGKVYAVPDANHDFIGDTVITIADGMFHPNGVAFRNGSLYVAEIHRVLRYDNIDKSVNNPPKPVIVNDTLPRRVHHGQKYLGFGPDGMLYLQIGAPCNVCEEKDPRFATIMRMKDDGSNLEIFAHGVRNSVGFDWHPVTREMYFTDNGRDWMGDNRPPDEINHAPRKGMHFGFPYCHGGDIADPVFGQKRKCDEFTPPVVKLPAHVAALGMRFYTGKMFPATYRNCAFVCEHGSWNRTIADGYRVDVVHFKNGKPEGVEHFATGWLQPFGVWGRPVDVLQLADGSLLISDDHAGAIYRITYSAPAK